MSANNITDANTIQAGEQLVIPGLEGVTGTLNSEVINSGNPLTALSARRRIPATLIEKLNHLISPSEFYVGANMIVSDQNSASALTNRMPARGGRYSSRNVGQAKRTPYGLWRR